MNQADQIDQTIQATMDTETNRGRRTSELLGSPMAYPVIFGPFGQRLDRLALPRAPRELVQKFRETGSNTLKPAWLRPSTGEFLSFSPDLKDTDPQRNGYRSPAFWRSVGCMPVRLTTQLGCSGLFFVEV